ncbi:hypothetical protein FQR65_LT00193 [Abscondita terminalis]|nr:hypothetical protein FQR65_LT00193 [Abscondita terminalis]
MDQQNAPNSLTEVTALIREWEDSENQPGYDPVPTLMKLAEKIELENENYLKMDPDPFDERHPSRIDPECKFGQILKALFRKDNFMTRLVNDYLRDSYYSRLGITNKSVDELNIAACRLMLDILPGLETSAVFQPDMDGLIQRLIKWSTNSIEPLQSYATGLLGAAMKIPDVANRYREQNSRLIPLMIRRLRALQGSSEYTSVTGVYRPFAHLSSVKSPPYVQEDGQRILKPLNTMVSLDDESPSKRKKLKLSYNISPQSTSPSHKIPGPNYITESSNSSWAELESYMIGNLQMYPLTLVTKQILILQYVTPMGEYQEVLGHVFAHNVLGLILNYVNVKETKEARLAFEALKYLAALLCHKKFSIEFIQGKYLECLLEVPRPSIAAAGVSICLYYLGYCEEAMECVCLLPDYVISNLVKYTLWLLECSHDSGRCHAIMFFGSTFQFRVILDEFDEQDGLRKLHNVIATLPILSNEENATPLNEDIECASRQIVRHVCVAYRRYMEAHLFIKVEQLRRSQIRPNSAPVIPAQPSYKACKSSPEEVQQQIETLLQLMPFRTHWQPVDQIYKLGGISLLLKIITLAYEWNNSGRAEMVRCALDVLAIACVIPKVVLLFCDQVDLPYDSVTVGVNIILGAASGEIIADAEVQMAALRVIVNCVCAPIHRVGATISRYTSSGTTSPSKKTKYKSSEELIQKVWESVRSNSGIMVLLQLMNVKTPITDADSLRTLACKAFAGLARSETVRQIVSKLPLFTSGQLHTLMRDPILQEKRQEHVHFQKHALELLERLSGKTKQRTDDVEVSLSNLHKANIVAQTKIHFNEKQLLQLIHQHLLAKGLVETAGALQKEAHLSSTIVMNSIHPPNKFRHTSTTPNRNRLSFSSPAYRNAVVSSASASDVNTTTVYNGASPAIKIKKKAAAAAAATPCPNLSAKPRLQKQLSAEPYLNMLVPKEDHEQPRITLDSIITEYLTNQHTLCKNPMATCPQFNLFEPHKCPDPKPKIQAANNFAIRSVRRQIGFQSKTLDRKFIHSRFCPVQTIRLPNDNGFYTCVKFMPGDQSIVAGADSGDIRIFNVHTGNKEASFSAHDSYVVYTEPNKDGQLLISSSTWGRPLSALWSMNGYDMKYSFDDEEYMEFSKTIQDRLIGTKSEVATIYDVNTGVSITSFIPTVSNRYTRNKATFSPNDDLVLSDGVLFDVSTGQQVRKLDKLNQTQSGVFHPNGLEIVSNTEVWDIRTFQLLKTVPVLNQSQVVFAPINSTIYAISLGQEDGEDQTFETSFKTVDASDYSSIATFDVKRNVYDLAINRFDSQIAIVENIGVSNTPLESVVRIYDVGRRRDDEDDQEEDDEEDANELVRSDDDGSDNDTIPMDASRNDNNGNEDDDDLGGDNDSSGSWTDVSEDSEDSNDSSDLSAIEDLLF